MRYVASTIPRIEDIAIKEIKEILKVNSKKLLPGKILFETKVIEDLIKKTRSINLIYQLITNFKFKRENDIYKTIKKIKFNIEEPFVVRGNVKENQKILRSEIEKNIGEIIYKQGYKVNLTEPKTTVYVDIIKDTCLIGIKLAENLFKRNYRIRTNNNSINACLAYALLRIADIKKTDTLLDPFCKDGVIAIEAYLYGVKKVYALDENINSIKNSRMNSKISKAKINLGNYDVNWLNTKLKKHSIDKIVTNLPFVSKTKNKEMIKKIYDGFFEQLPYILKKNAVITIISPKIDLFKEFIKKYSYKVKRERNISLGEVYYKVIVFG